MTFPALITLALLMAPSAPAQRQAFTVNPDTSDVKMTLKTTHEVVVGSFHIQSGLIEFDRSSPTMSGSVVVLAGSGKTGNGSRDKRMNKEILSVERYATITFEPKTYTGNILADGDSHLQVSGIFTLLGRTHEITVPMLVHLDGNTATASAHLIVPYVQWGLKDPSLLIWRAEHEVAVDLVLRGGISK